MTRFSPDARSRDGDTAAGTTARGHASGKLVRGKRAMDVSLSLAALGVFAPVTAAAALCIRREDGGPVLFVQERVGRGRRPFSILKLRTMRGGEITRSGAGCARPGSTRRRSSSTCCAAT